MRNIIYNASNYYSMSGSGTLSRSIFTDESDKLRFILSLISFQSPTQIHNIRWYHETLKKRNLLPIGLHLKKQILKSRYIELIAFCITDNSYRFIIKSSKDHIPSVYMHRVLTSYSKYFNSKYNLKGHVFSGPYEAEKLKNSNTDLIVEVNKLHSSLATDHDPLGSSIDSKFSSLTDYTIVNRWGDFLNTSIILRHFGGPSKYKSSLNRDSK